MDAVAVAEKEERGILQREPRYVSIQEVRRAIETLRLQAEANGVSDMSMEEVDQIIAECRKQLRRERGRQ